MGYTTLFVLLATAIVLAAAEIPSKQLNDGNKMPGIALGTYDSSQDKAKTRQAVIWAIEAGYRHIDTAALYQNEKEIGEAIKDVIQKGLVKREDLFITTKLWNDKHRQEQVVPALRESLQRLGLDYVDLYLIHSPVATQADNSFSDVDYLETWKGMEDAQKLGLTKSIGVSNFNTEQIDRVIANGNVKPAVNEIEVHPSLTQLPLVANCQNRSIVVMAYSPFGYLVSRNKADTAAPKIDDPALTKIAQKYGKTTSQVVLRYLVDRGTVPIPKSTNKDRLQQNIDIFDFKLTAEEIETINKFNSNSRIIDGKIWKSHPYYPFNKD